MLDRAFDGLSRLIGLLMVLALGGMVVLVFGNVVLRYGFNSGFTISEELSRWLFVWLTFMGAVVALRERAHLGTDSLVSRLPRRGKQVCLALSQLIVLWMCVLVLQGAWAQTRINLGATSAVMEVSMGLFYACGVVFAVLAIAIVLQQGWRLVSGRMSDEELVGIRESEDEPHATAQRP